MQEDFYLPLPCSEGLDGKPQRGEEPWGRMRLFQGKPFVHQGENLLRRGGPGH